MMDWVIRIWQSSDPKEDKRKKHLLERKQGTAKSLGHNLGGKGKPREVR